MSTATISLRGNHAVAQVGLREVEGVVENLHLALDLGVLVGFLVDGLLKILVEVAHRDDAELGVLVLDAADAQRASLISTSREERHGVEQAVEQGREGGHEPQRAVGVDAEYGLWEKLAREEDYAGGYQCLRKQHKCLVVEP